MAVSTTCPSSSLASDATWAIVAPAAFMDMDMIDALEFQKLDEDQRFCNSKWL